MDSDESKPVKSSKLLPSLPKWELILCFTVWISHSVYAWYVVWEASSRLQNRLYSGYFEPGWSLLDYPPRDTSNYEWCSYLAFLPYELTAYFVHAVSMKLIDRSINDRRKSEALMTAIWIVLLWSLLGWVGVATTIIDGFLMLAVARSTNWKPAVWLCACGLLATLASDKYPLANDADLRYRFSVYVAYKLLHYLSFCMYDIDAKRGKRNEDDKEKEVVYDQNFLSAYYSQMRYTLYPPYASVLIVTYSDYLQQWRRRPATDLNWSRIVSVFGRFLFWTLFNDFLLHYVYNNAMMLDQYLLAEVDLITLCAVGYTAGQYFYMKYVSIFGLNTIFALVDGMSPPKWPPICISRVALYSNMWRFFDRGLYSFLKDHIFTPVASPSFSFAKRTLATFFCFAFVWLWHGMSYGFLYWVSMNFIEIMLENLAKEIYRRKPVYDFFNRNFSPLSMRRIRASLHIFCTAWGIFSIFYFLGGEHVGHIFVNRLVVDEGLMLKAPIFYLLVLGYFFAQCCMEIEAYVQ